MRHRITVGLLVAATALGGLLAGGNFVRMFIETPAWQQVGSTAWAEFSRHADLGSGRIWYPFLAIGGAALNIAATVMYFRHGRVPRRATAPLTIALGCVITGLALTAFAAPQMLSLRVLGDDPVAIQRAFDAFSFWGNWRGVAQIAAFSANLWALAVLS
jgi:hypothetical protein